MELIWYVVRVAVVALIVVAVAEISKRSPRLGAVLLSLPIMSILAFQFSWRQHHDLPSLSRMARDTLAFVPRSLPFSSPSYWPNGSAGASGAA